MSDTLGLYIHIPFCKSKCPYCDFYSMRGNENDFANYTEQLKKKIEYWGKKVSKRVDTIYFGGGTPSVMGAGAICDILDSIFQSFEVEKNAEITMEANPASGRFFDFDSVKSKGVNRVSLGVQSANLNELRILGRLHSPDDAAETVRLIKRSGIENISLDLMLGIPDQTQESLRRSIDFCVEADIKHISSYILKIEKNTVFDKRRDSYSFPDDDKTAELYLFAVRYLKEKGFSQYEISNFCLKGYESRHNLKYWNLDDYLGIGPAAHSFIDGKRFYYSRSLDDFYADIITDDGIGGTKEEYVMLKLRLTSGLDLEKYKEAFGEYPSKDFLDKIDYFEKVGLTEREGSVIRLTPNGFLLSNSVISELI